MDHKITEKSYNWKRFWCSREAGFNLGDDGFLFDPDSEFGKVLNSNLVSSEDLYQYQCLGLLGEPGIGKSYEIRKLSGAISPQFHETDNVLSLDLRSYGQESRLYSAIFETEKFKKWIAGRQRLYLFLDSLDECLLHIKTVTSLLEEEFAKYPVERLALRIACRTAEWPYSFEQALEQIYGKENIKVHELVPLRKKDVHNAANCEGINVSDQFIEALVKNNAVPLAIKPVTLDMLIKLYKQTGIFLQSNLNCMKKAAS